MYWKRHEGLLESAHTFPIYSLVAGSSGVVTPVRILASAVKVANN